MTGTIRAFYTALETRDWEAVGALFDDDVVYEVPQTGERVRGRGPTCGSTASTPVTGTSSCWPCTRTTRAERRKVAFRVAGQEMVNLAFFRLNSDGRIVGVRDYWPEPYDPPPGREHLVSRY